MFELTAIALIVLWLLGFFTATTLGGLVHILLVIALLTVVLGVLKGQRL